jgi:hypothetical protein
LIITRDNKIKYNWLDNLVKYKGEEKHFAVDNNFDNNLRSGTVVIKASGTA